MAKFHGGGGAYRVRSNHPALAVASPRLLIQGGEFHRQFVCLCRFV